MRPTQTVVGKLFGVLSYALKDHVLERPLFVLCLCIRASAGQVTLDRQEATRSQKLREIQIYDQQAAGLALQRLAGSACTTPPPRVQ